MNVCSALEPKHKQIIAHVLWICQQATIHQSGPAMDRTDIDADLHVQVAQIYHVMVMASAIQEFTAKVIALALSLTHSVPIVHSP